MQKDDSALTSWWKMPPPELRCWRCPSVRMTRTRRRRGLGDAAARETRQGSGLSEQETLSPHLLPPGYLPDSTESSGRIFQRAVLGPGQPSVFLLLPGWFRGLGWEQRGSCLWGRRKCTASHASHGRPPGKGETNTGTCETRWHRRLCAETGVCHQHRRPHPFLGETASCLPLPPQGLSWLSLSKGRAERNVSLAQQRHRGQPREDRP